MSDNSTNIELLIRFLDGELSEQEQTSLLEAINNSPSLKEELEALRTSRQAVQHFGLKENIARIRLDMLQETKPVAKLIPFYRKPVSVAAAILLIALVGGLYFYFETSSQEFYASHFSSYSVGITRGSAPSPLTSAYEKKDYTQVNALFSSIAQPNNEDYFFFGLSLLEQNKSKEASVFFETILEKKSADSSGIYMEEAEYYLALAYINLHQPEKAYPLFEKIRKDRFHHFHSKVNAMDMWRLKILDWKN